MTTEPIAVADNMLGNEELFGHVRLVVQDSLQGRLCFGESACFELGQAQLQMRRDASRTQAHNLLEMGHCLVNHP
mgnify:CR=1 FL=1